MKKITLVVALLGMVGFTGIASAADAEVSEAGPYVGINLGVSDSGLTGSKIGGATSVDDRDFAYKLYGGYQIDKTWGVEVAYDNLGKTNYRDAGTGAKGDVDLYALSLAATGKYAVTSDFDVFGKLGYAVVHSKDQFAGSTTRGYDNSWLVGAGVAYHFDKNIDVKAEWNRYVDVARTSADADTFGVGVAYKF